MQERYRPSIFGHSRRTSNPALDSGSLERLHVEEGLGELGLATTDTEANFSWIDLGDADEAALVAGLAERSIAVRPGSLLGGPGSLRVSYGTPAENGRMLAALGELLD